LLTGLDHSSSKEIFGEDSNGGVEQSACVDRVGVRPVSLTAFSASARAEVLFDSLDSLNTGVMGDLVGVPTYPLDASFATGASTFHATDIALLLNQAAAVLPGDMFTVSLQGGVPLADVTFLGPLLGLNVLPGQGPVLGSATLPISHLSTSLSVEHFNQFASIPLKPNSFYWIDLNLSEFQREDGPAVGWGTTDDNSGPGVSGGYNSSDATDFGFFPNNRDGGEEAFQMEVATPEPSTWALMLMGFGGLALVAYRRRSALAASRV
jgi:hypothetical protein